MSSKHCNQGNTRTIEPAYAVHFELPKYFSPAFLDNELDFGDGSVAVGVRHRPS
jgi:hypothetical protein